MKFLIGAIAAGVIATGVQTVRLDHAQLALAARDATIAANTKALDDFKAQRDLAAAHLDTALALARPIAAAHEAKSADLAVYTPKGADDCARLVDLDAHINPEASR